MILLVILVLLRLVVKLLGMFLMLIIQFLLFVYLVKMVINHKIFKIHLILALKYKIVLKVIF